MKKIYLTAVLLLFVQLITAQTDGMTYQAVIIDQNTQEIPGLDVSGNYLSDTDVSLRFSILDQFDMVEFQEVHFTRTDPYGMVNLIIGQGESTPDSPLLFNEIDWDGSPRDLRVDININSLEFSELSRQPLLFVPYAYHRNITATGTLTVDQQTLLNSNLTVANQSPTLLSGDLTVQGNASFEGTTTFNNIVVLNHSDLQGPVDIGGPTNHYGILNVNNGQSTTLTGALSVTNGSPTSLSGSLNVAGIGNFQNNFNVLNSSPSQLSGLLNVDGNTTLQSDFSVLNGSQSLLTGNLHVNGTTLLDGPAVLYDNLDVIGVSTLHGVSNMQSPVFANAQVTIEADIAGGQSDLNSYPLIVRGSKHGIAIQTNTNNLNNEENFITFFNANGQAVGRIEGQNSSDVSSSPEYIYDTAILTANIAAAAAGVVGATTSSTICVGLGGCVTAPVPSLVISAGINAAVAAANLVAFQIFAFENLGVTYESGSADYAEWLKRMDVNEHMDYGDIVSVQGGQISKRIHPESQLMVISHHPAILGNMPETSEKEQYEMVAFMGQVPVKVVGEVAIGDYIIASGKDDGFGRAIHPNAIEIEQLSKVVGTAWTAQKDVPFGYVNVAIGIDNGPIIAQLKAQEMRIEAMELEMQSIRNLLGMTATSETEASLLKGDDEKHATEQEYTTLTAIEMHPPIDLVEVEATIDALRDSLEDMGIDTREHPIYSKIFYEPSYRQSIVDEVVQVYEVQRQQAIEYDQKMGY